MRESAVVMDGEGFYYSRCASLYTDVFIISLDQLTPTTLQASLSGTLPPRWRDVVN